MKKQWIRIERVRYKISKPELFIVKQYLAEQIPARELAKQLGKGWNHQHLPRIITALTKQWYQEGKLKI